MVIFNNVIVSFQGCKGQVFASLRTQTSLSALSIRWNNCQEVLQKLKLTTFFLQGGLLKLQKCAFSLETIGFFVPDCLVLRVSSWWKWTARAVFQVPKNCCLCWFIPKVNSKTSRLLCCFRKVPCWNLKLGNNGENIPPEIWRMTTQKWFVYLVYWKLPIFSGIEWYLWKPFPMIVSRPTNPSVFKTLNSKKKTCPPFSPFFPHKNLKA